PSPFRRDRKDGVADSPNLFRCSVPGDVSRGGAGCWTSSIAARAGRIVEPGTPESRTQRLPRGKSLLYHLQRSVLAGDLELGIYMPADRSQHDWCVPPEAVPARWGRPHWWLRNSHGSTDIYPPARRFDCWIHRALCNRSGLCLLDHDIELTALIFWRAGCTRVLPRQRSGIRDTDVP